MFKQRKSSISRGAKSRIVVLTIAFVILAAILIQRLFVLQIVNGESYLNDFAMSIKKERTLNSTRGEIYDCNGKVLAYNRLAYSVTFEDNNSYETTHIRNLTLNSILYKAIQIIESHGDSTVGGFRIQMGDSGSYEYNCTGFTLSRFKADIFGKAYIDAPSDDLKSQSLTEEEKNISASDLIDLLCSKQYYGILDPEITAAERESYGLPETFSTQEILQLTYMRSNLAQNSYQRYNSITVAKDVCDETVSQLMENVGDLTGIDISEDYLRVYNDAEYFAPIIGYTGQVSAEELTDLQKEDSSYTSTDIVGKVGLEQVMETSLQGDKGSETIYVDNMGRTLSEESKVEPQAGDSLYLTIDGDLQKVAYHILEQYIAGIVYANIIDTKEFDTEYIQSSDEVKIPIYDVYYSLFENNVLDVEHLSSADASANEQFVYNAFLTKSASIFSEIKNQLTVDSPAIYSELSEEMQVYQTYIVDTMLVNTGILNSDAIDETDLTYQAWNTDHSISLKEFLTYAISKNWIDITGVTEDSAYMDTTEVYTALADYIAQYLSGDTDFCKRVFRYMLIEESLSGTEVCLLLFDQGVLDMDTTEYDNLTNGTLSAYDFIREKIYNLQLRPSQLALDPCSGSIVITDPNNGDVKACVTYPGYDNNRLVNDMDSAYYNKLATDLSSPFYSRATQETLAPGSTFKIVTGTAGVMESQIAIDESIVCTGIFTEVATPIKCWIYSGAHGAETLSTAIRDSCNYYFNTIGYRLSMIGGEYDDDTGLSTLAKYASMYGLDSTSGVEVPESSPHISDNDAVRSAMGQGTNSYTVTQLARYVSAIANSGTCYDLTLIDRITDTNGNTIDDNEPAVHSTIDLPTELWNAIHTGMRGVVQNHSAFSGFTGVAVAGKTGTAQERTDRPNHALFMGYAPYDDPQMAIAVRVANGYSSANAATIARDVISYYFSLAEENTLVTGHAGEIKAGNTRTD
ncbi:MAG: penicillin-binding transpeptidase domain-containing protein [Lachnospiraceae bacterium]|nr:penicillin-binding transpeptidase domain-containing protein [Lachnospiraceae bacterium]